MEMKPTKLEPFLSIGGTVLGPNRRKYWLWKQKCIRPGFTLTGTPRTRTQHNYPSGLNKDHAAYMRQIRSEYHAAGLTSAGKPRMKTGRKHRLLEIDGVKMIMTDAARKLGISVSTLYRRLKKIKATATEPKSD